jgi:hypothetical protein
LRCLEGMRQGGLTDIDKERGLIQRQVRLQVLRRIGHARIAAQSNALRHVIQKGLLAALVLGRQAKIAHVTRRNESLDPTLPTQYRQAFNAQFGHYGSTHAHRLFGSTINDLRNGRHVLTNASIQNLVAAFIFFKTERHDAQQVARREQSHHDAPRTRRRRLGWQSSTVSMRAAAAWCRMLHYYIRVIPQHHHARQAPFNRGQNGLLDRGVFGHNGIDPTVGMLGLEHFGNQNLLFSKSQEERRATLLEQSRF